jgi:hypothetical protein
MYRKILISGVTAAAIVGAGGTALALTGSDQPATGSGTSSSAAGSTAKHATKHANRQGRMLRRLSHGQFVTRGKNGTFVTHDLITGTVTSASSSSITVQAADKTSETFAVNKDTKVRERTLGKKGTNGKRTGGSVKAGSLSDLAKGDHVIVTGTGASTKTAKRIVEVTGAK